MKRVIVQVLLLVCATLGASAPLHAQARGPVREGRGNAMPVEKPPPVLDEATRARMLAEAQAWLGRLVGRFEVDQERITVGGVQNFNGTALCSHIGSGPGVQCSMHMLGIGKGRAGETVIGPAFEHFSQDGIRMPIKRTSLLLFFGINPETIEIQLVMVDNDLVTARAGLLAGHAVDFADNWNVCYRVVTHCWMAAQVAAPPAGEVVMRFSVDHYGNVRKHPLTTASGHTADNELRLRRLSDANTNGAQ